MTTAGAGKVVRRTDAARAARSERARAARFNRVMLRVVVAAVFASVFLYVVGMTRVNAGSKQINALRAQIAAEESRRQQLEIALSERQNLDMIRSEAVTRLGLVLPGTWSVRVVSLPGDAAGEAQTVYEGAD